MSRTAQWARVLDAADYELRHRNVIEANRHLRAMTPARRAELEAEWEAPVSDGRRTGPEAF
jgi:hypothetical protein